MRLFWGLSLNLAIPLRVLTETQRRARTSHQHSPPLRIKGCFSSWLCAQSANSNPHLEEGVLLWSLSFTFGRVVDGRGALSR